METTEENMNVFVKNRRELEKDTEDTINLFLKSWYNTVAPSEIVLRIFYSEDVTCHFHVTGTIPLYEQQKYCVGMIVNWIWVLTSGS